jgi:hypothetical protein
MRIRFRPISGLFHRRSGQPAFRGQGLVETALILPILALLLVMALDFGRVFFGWVALQNAARIGADFAAQTPLAWKTMDSSGQDKRDRYVDIVQGDLDAINCDLADGGAIPDPTFENNPITPDPADAYEDGDYAVVDLQCSFPLITPLAEAILGGPVSLAAHEEFPVHTRIVQGIPPAPPPPAQCLAPLLEIPELTLITMLQARTLWVADGFVEANFQPPVVTSGPPAGRNGDKIVLTQSIPKNTCEASTVPITVTFQP